MFLFFRMVRNNPWKAYHSLMLWCLMLLQVVNSKHRTIRNQSGKTEPPNSNGDEPMHSNRKIVTTFFWSPELLTYFSLQLFNEGWEEETGVEIPASKSTVLRGHESEVFICAWTQQLIYWLLALVIVLPEFGTWMKTRLHQLNLLLVIAFRRVELKCRATKMSPHLTGMYVFSYTLSAK